MKPSLKMEKRIQLGFQMPENEWSIFESFTEKKLGEFLKKIEKRQKEGNYDNLDEEEVFMWSGCIMAYTVIFTFGLRKGILSNWCCNSFHTKIVNGVKFEGMSLDFEKTQSHEDIIPLKNSNFVLICINLY
jgi:hypothetical protein